MTFNFLGPGLTVNVEAKVKEQIILDSSEAEYLKFPRVTIIIKIFVVFGQQRLSFLTLHRLGLTFF